MRRPNVLATPYWLFRLALVQWPYGVGALPLCLPGEGGEGFVWVRLWVPAHPSCLPS